MEYSHFVAVLGRSVVLRGLRLVDMSRRPSLNWKSPVKIAKRPSIKLLTRNARRLSSRRRNSDPGLQRARPLAADANGEGGEGEGGDDAGDDDDVAWYVYVGQSTFKIPRDLTHVRADPSGLTWIEKRRRNKRLSIPDCAFVNLRTLLDVDLRGGVDRIGQGAFEDCVNLRRVRVPSSVAVVEIGAFKNCRRLEEATLDEGVGCVECHAFQNCRALRRIRIPSTVRKVGPWAFCDCESLEEVELCEGLHWIGRGAFSNCVSLKKVRIPSTVTLILDGVFRGCRRLMTVELPEELQAGNSDALRGCHSLRNVVYPQASLDNKDHSGECHDLGKLFQSQKATQDALKARFREPIHKVCYYHSYRSSEEVMEELKRVVGSMPGESQTSLEGGQDCLGMTPLHILACSTKQDLDLYRFVFRHFPRGLVTEDRWGCLPLFYAIWGDAPDEIVKFLVDCHLFTFPDFEIHFSEMAENLCRSWASQDSIQTMIDIQQNSFPESSLDWVKLARELTIWCLLRCSSFDNFPAVWVAMVQSFSENQAHEELVQRLLELKRRFFPDPNETDWRMVCEKFVQPLEGWWRREDDAESLVAFSFLIRCNIAGRRRTIGLRRWRRYIKEMVQLTPLNSFQDLPVHFDIVHSKVTFYDSEWHWRKDALTMLELALWKYKIDKEEEISPDAKARCRINCGAEVVIPNVVPYLFSKERRTYYDSDDPESSDEEDWT